ncbi:MerR family transcriptional regulator [Streptomyces sp. NRRL WC-3744]|uniref:MerR family transcriptional regulator n=1 Tax=Streptomyces sp. NRRL WC-3744 TaxID=1463935 RepID=UPI000996164A|nr:MerR family transcriptional regulator [Streptomyces sp. NRRL WC-3744]
MKSSEYGTPADGADEPLSIGALAGHFGLAAHVLRHWEAMGLLNPPRDSAGRRQYGSAHITRVAVIMRAKEAGLSLETIRSLSATADPVQRRGILREQTEALRSRIAAARASLELIECALDCDHEDVTQCPHYQQTVADGIGGFSPGSPTRREPTDGVPGVRRGSRPRCS